MSKISKQEYTKQKGYKQDTNSSPHLWEERCKEKDFLRRWQKKFKAKRKLDLDVPPNPPDFSWKGETFPHRYGSEVNPHHHRENDNRKFRLKKRKGQKRNDKPQRYVLPHGGWDTRHSDYFPFTQPDSKEKLIPEEINHP